PPGTLAGDDETLLAEVHGLLEKTRKNMDVQAFHEVLATIWAVIRACNVYTDRQAPWKLKKEDPERMATVLYVLAEAIRNLAILTLPFMPRSMDRMLDQLAVARDRRAFAFLGPGHALVPVTALPKPEGVFPRLVVEGQGP
ncbi:MAG TPA: class I tRNA ligase family protein, partial [Rhodospirillaceae bacterium]|nr:class I tRNA ligase family protein [Rhodospirillaceae bacterium]